MRKLLLFSLCALSCANAAADDLNIKGLKLGMTEEEVLATMGDGAGCNDVASIALDARVCNFKHGTAHESYAEHPVQIMRLLKAGKLVDVYISGLPPDDFVAIETALVSKFGKPAKSEKSEIQNRMGAKFQNVGDIWDAGDSQLLFEKYCGKVTESCLGLRSLAYAAAREAEQEKKSKKDM